MSMTLGASQQNDYSLAIPGLGDGGPISRRLSPPERNLYLSVKGALDFALAAALLVVAGPVIGLAAVLIRLTSRGPAFYSQVRLGLGGKPYRIWKLRTMYHLAEAKSGPQWSACGDPRVTPLGRFLRRTHLDELPQLWNILRGEMSLIGPRPERPEFVPALAGAVPLYTMRLLVRPGVTGLAQVQLPPDTGLDSVRAKIAYDLHYISDASAWMDLRILAATAVKVFGGSFSLLRKVFRFPEPARVDEQYQSLQRPRPADPAPGPLDPGFVPVS